MIILRKIKAGALQFVLFVGAIIAVLLMSFLLLTYTHQHFEKKTDVLIEVLRSADYGMAASLMDDFSLEVSHPIDRVSDIPITISVKREFWGVFEKRTVLTSHKNTNHTKTALIGGKDEEELPALYVNDHQRPVVLAGNTKITGTAYLPEQGLKMGNIAGNSYYRSQLLYGKSMKSNAVLPNLAPELENQMNRLANKKDVPKGKLLNRLPKEGIQNSFEVETVIYKDRLVHLKNIKLTGNIIIVADDKIIVEASARLNDVLLIGPEIEIHNSVNGVFQAIATESIKVGKNCNLEYPTALLVNKKYAVAAVEQKGQSQFNQISSIYLDSNTNVSGMVMVLDEAKIKQYIPELKIEKNTIVNGEVYCTKNVELKGTINGMVSTDGFIALENGTVYQNHIYNGTINSENLSYTYTGILLASREGNKKVMKWLY
ncbi:hypothetical protein SAMN04488009_0164 [Maribacter sedimenticola]|uniref:Uncharacterized protein n=1 Tax=Maribacter sedimenticola TaxID=228956 RepID=A0ABY1SMA7_9FLAO|nr:hypothetical protein [Maribacter sedimenticola]SNR80586.1 hypothetical protein SAMN04488009_0164 [Maribacter sedimenticola]